MNTQGTDEPLETILQCDYIESSDDNIMLTASEEGINQLSPKTQVQMRLGLGDNKKPASKKKQRSTTTGNNVSN